MTQAEGSCTLKAASFFSLISSMQQWLKWLLCSFLCCTLILLPPTFSWDFSTPVALATTLSTQPFFGPLASLHTYQEQPGQTTFRSKQSLRDRADRSWQVILFKRYQSDTLQGLYLRLVGFPGLVKVEPAKPLNITTGSSMQWQATPALDPQTQALPDNAVQYDVAEVLAALEGDIPLQMNVPLAGGRFAQVVVPPFAVREWRALAEQSPA